MKDKFEVMEAITEMLQGSFISIEGKEIRVPLTNGKEVKLVVTVAKEALGSKPEFSNEPTQEEADQLYALLSALGV